MTVPLVLLSALSFAFAFTVNINPLKSSGWFKDLIYKFGRLIIFKYEICK